MDILNNKKFVNVLGFRVSDNGKGGFRCMTKEYRNIGALSEGILRELGVSFILTDYLWTFKIVEMDESHIVYENNEKRLYFIKHDIGDKVVCRYYTGKGSNTNINVETLHLHSMSKLNMYDVPSIFTLSPMTMIEVLMRVSDSILSTGIRCTGIGRNAITFENGDMLTVTFNEYSEVVLM